MSNTLASTKQVLAIPLGHDLEELSEPVSLQAFYELMAMEFDCFDLQDALEVGQEFGGLDVITIHQYIIELLKGEFIEIIPGNEGEHSPISYFIKRWIPIIG